LNTCNIAADNINKTFSVDRYFHEKKQKIHLGKLITKTSKEISTMIPVGHLPTMSEIMYCPIFDQFQTPARL